MNFEVVKLPIMRKASGSGMNNVLRLITMCYVLLIIPGGLIYLGIILFTDLRGKELFNSFLPVALVLLIMFVYYLIRPGRLLGFSRPKHEGQSEEQISSESHNTPRQSEQK